MSNSTDGITLEGRSPLVAQWIELLSSMRFAISLLALIAIASVIGTVLTQNEPMPNYVNQFGPLWFDVFAHMSLYTVYSAWWFLLIMAFLVMSTTLCIVRNAPKMIADMKSWRENVREQSLRNFHHHLEWTSAETPAKTSEAVAALIGNQGYKVKLAEKENAILVTAKQGAANKLGYIFAHTAIVVICIGGLLDSTLPIRAQQWLFNKIPYVGNGVIADIPAQHRLGLGNPAFRGNTFIPEGSSSNTAIIATGDGALIQDLPFTIELKKFNIDFYSTGMPKLFASEVVITDHASGKTIPATIKVNEPLIHDGIAVYQSSFEDGGSHLKLAGYPMHGAVSKVFPLEGIVGQSTPLHGSSGNDYTIEWSGFRPFNIENMSANSGQDVRAVNQAKNLTEDLSSALDKKLGSAANVKRNKDLRNVGPSVQYKLRDKNGQAREYSNYMMPLQIDGAAMFLVGVRDTPAENFRYLRIPADDKNSVEEWMRLRAALHNPDMRSQAARRYAEKVQLSAANKVSLREQLAASAQRGLTIFAGDSDQSGYMAVASFIARLPQGEQEKAADIFMKILNGSMWELWQLAREKEGLSPVASDEKHAQFLQLATNAIADAFFYPAPVLLQLQSFEEVKASVFQVTRSPGKKIVYLGCLLLVVGIFAMIYIRERRVWVWVRPQQSGGSHALMAMSTQRRTLDFDAEFERMKNILARQ